MAAGLLALFLTLSLTPVTNNDIWLHMANGKWILAHGKVPLADPYSFSAAGNRFHAHEWLAGVIFELVHRFAGVPGLILFKTLLGATALLFCALAARQQRASREVIGACLWLALVVVNARFLERPEMFSYALTGLYVWVLGLEKRKLDRSPPLSSPAPLRHPSVWLGSSLFWWLVPVQWLWVQMHGYFLTGLALVGLFLAAETISQLREKYQGHSPLKLAPRLVSGCAAVFFMALVGLLNPNGIEVYTFPFRLAGGQNLFMQTIFEWKPTFTTGPVVLSSMFLGFCLWLALLTLTGLSSTRMLSRRLLWRCTTIAGLGGLFLIRRHLAHLPAAAHALLPKSTWLWPPSDLLSQATHHSALSQQIARLARPLGLSGPGGADILLLLWVGLLIWAVSCWRRPVLAAWPVLTLVLTLLLQQSGTHAPLLLALSLGGSLVYAVARRSLPIWHAALAAFFLYLAVHQNRNIVNFALVTLPILAPALTRTGRALAAVPGGRQPARAARALPTLRVSALALLCFLLAAMTLTTGWPYTRTVVKKTGLGIGEKVPTGAVQYLRTHHIGGQVFDKYSYGAYLIYELFPETRVYMDSRNGVYGEDLLRTYLKALYDRKTTDQVFRANRFDYVLVDYAFYPEPMIHPGLFSYLADHPEWVLVYFDDTSVLFLRDRPEHAAAIARDGYRVLDPLRYRPGFLKGLSPRDRARYKLESRQALLRVPRSLTAKFLRAEFLIASGQLRNALELLEKVLDQEPNHLFALGTAAQIARKLGDQEQALALYHRALLVDPRQVRMEREMRDLEEKMAR